MNAKDKDDWIPLLYATAEGQEEVVDLLIAVGADVNAKRFDGKTPLDSADSRWTPGRTSSRSSRCRSSSTFPKSRHRETRVWPGDEPFFSRRRT